MKEFKCTRNAPYQYSSCLGHTNTSARQGYYINANSKNEAFQAMAKLFPKEINSGFTVEER
jgi:hypothetical protein